MPVILGEIKRLFRDGGTIKVGRSLKELSLKIKRFIDEYSIKSGTEPSVKEIAEHFCIDPEQVAQALEASMLPMSLTQEGEDGENQLDIPVESHDERLSEVIALNQTVSTLNEKDKNIIFLRFYKNMTQNETAKKLGMTQVQVSRREKIILRELRVKLKQFCIPKAISKKSTKILYIRYTMAFLAAAFLAGCVAVFSVFASLAMFLATSAAYVFFVSFYRKAYYKQTKYCVYRNKIYLKKGVFFSKEITMPTNKIQSTETITSPIQKWLGLCTIIFRFAGGEVRISNLDADSADIIKCEIKGGDCYDL